MKYLTDRVRNCALIGAVTLSAYLSGNSAEVPRRIQESTLAGQPSVRVSFPTETNTIYTLKVKYDLGSTNWAKVVDVPGNGNERSVNIASSANEKAFYTVVNNK